MLTSLHKTTFGKMDMKNKEDAACDHCIVDDTSD